jgi:hypothetical protein
MPFFSTSVTGLVGMLAVAILLFQVPSNGLLADAQTGSDAVKRHAAQNNFIMVNPSDLISGLSDAGYTWR